MAIGFCWCGSFSLFNSPEKCETNKNIFAVETNGSETDEMNERLFEKANAMKRDGFCGRKMLGMIVCVC